MSPPPQNNKSPARVFLFCGGEQVNVINLRVHRSQRSDFCFSKNRTRVGARLIFIYKNRSPLVGQTKHERRRVFKSRDRCHLLSFQNSPTLRTIFLLTYFIFLCIVFENARKSKIVLRRKVCKFLIGGCSVSQPHY